MTATEGLKAGIAGFPSVCDAALGQEPVRQHATMFRHALDRLLLSLVGVQAVFEGLAHG